MPFTAFHLAGDSCARREGEGWPMRRSSKWKLAGLALTMALAPSAAAPPVRGILRWTAKQSDDGIARLRLLFRRQAMTAVSSPTPSLSDRQGSLRWVRPAGPRVSPSAGLASSSLPAPSHEAYEVYTDALRAVGSGDLALGLFTAAAAPEALLDASGAVAWVRPARLVEGSVAANAVGGPVRASVFLARPADGTQSFDVLALLTPAPEPGSAVLLSTGLLVVASALHRRGNRVIA
jgi:hypothetical protein